MIIEKVSMKNFRKFVNQSFSFKDGLNEFIEDNEWGKTTITDAIRYAITDDKIKIEDVTVGSPNDPEVQLDIVDAEEIIHFEAKGREIKTKNVREKISKYFGADYDYLVKTLLIVKHGDLDRFTVDRYFIERMLKMDNITNISGRVNGLFTQKGIFSKAKIGEYINLTNSIEDIERDVNDLDVKLTTSAEIKKKLKMHEINLQKLVEKSMIIESEEKVIKQLLDKAEIDEQDDTIKKLKKKKINAEEIKDKCKTDLKKIESDITAVKKTIEKGKPGELKTLYRKRDKVFSEIEDFDEIISEIARIEKRKILLDTKLDGLNLANLQKDYKKWEKANTRVEAGNRIGIKAEFKKGSVVLANGKKLTAGLESEYLDRVSIAVDKNVSLDVWSGGKSIASDFDILKEMMEKYETLEKLETIINKCNELEELNEELTDILGGKTGKIIFKERSESKLELKKVDKLIADAEKAEKSQQKTRDDLTNLEKSKTLLEERIKSAEKTVKELNAELAGMKNIESSEMEEIIKRLNLLPHGMVEKYKGMDSKVLRIEYNNAVDNKQKTLKAIISSKDVIQECKSEISDVSEEVLERKRVTLSALIDKKREADKYLSLLRGLNVLFPELEKTLHENVFSKIQNKTREYFKIITNNAFNEIAISHGKTSETYSLINNQGIQLDGPEYLSDGTRDQLFFALRFAMIDQFSRGDSKFLVLDEPFAHTDHTREKRIREILNIFVNEGWQLIIFSCRK